MLMAQMLIEIKQGYELPRHADFSSDAMARAFWRLTFATGRKYIRGLDAHGDPLLVKHEREQEGYDRRLRITPLRNLSGPIIRRYNNHVFRIDAERPPEEKSDFYALIRDDADGHGTPLETFMAKALQSAQINREAYIMPDSTKESDAGDITQAQAQAAEYRQFLRLIEADCVVNYLEYDDSLIECIVVLCDETGRKFAMQYDAKEYREIELDTDGKRVTGIGETSPHGYDALPIVRLRPFCEESQISPLAEAQKAITNVLSLAYEELYNVTFSLVVASGVSAAEVKDAPVGNNRMLCLPNPAAAVTTIGADPAQATSLRDMITDEQRALYQAAGITADEPTKSGNPESGIAKAFKHNDLSANLAALAQSVEVAENNAVWLLCQSAGVEYPGDCKYPDEFDIPSIADDLGEVIQTLTLTNMPKTLKRQTVLKYAKTHFALDSVKQKELEAELATIGDDPLTMPGRTAGT